MPSTKMTDMPTCHGTFDCWKPISENVTTALSPMPEASANGRLLIRPMQMHMSAAPIAVAVAAPANGTPAALRMPGFTNMMYAMVRNVVTPASNSVLKSVPRSLNLKKLSMCSPFARHLWTASRVLSGAAVWRPCTIDTALPPRELGADRSYDRAGHVVPLVKIGPR